MRELKPMKSLSDIIEEQKLCKKYPYFWSSYLYEKKLWYWQRSHLYLTEKHGTFDGQVVEVVDKDRKHFIVGVCWDVPFTYDSYISEDYEIWPSDDFNSYDDYDEECFLNNE